MKKVLVVAAVIALTSSVGVFAQSSGGSYTSTVPVTTSGGNGGGGGSPVPEPATLALLVASTAGVGFKAWRQKQARQ